MTDEELTAAVRPLIEAITAATQQLVDVFAKAEPIPDVTPLERAISWGVVGAADAAPEGLDLPAIYRALGNGVGVVVGSNWCCPAHAMAEIAAVASTALARAQEEQSDADPAEAPQETKH